jgi:hypothetical protein
MFARDPVAWLPASRAALVETLLGAVLPCGDVAAFGAGMNHQ